MKNFSSIRRDYINQNLDEKNVYMSPIDQFERWFEEALKIQSVDANCMVLSTVDKNGAPDSRMVLLKEFKDGKFWFYTHYNSPKAMQIKKNPRVALNFYWPQLARQVRVRGNIERAPEKDSDDYFASRPMDSQLSAHISEEQSSVVSSREELEQKFADIKKLFEGKPIQRPAHWGGYVVIPHEIEFWQGHNNRLHDRILYLLKGKKWAIQRLAP